MKRKKGDTKLKSKKNDKKLKAQDKKAKKVKKKPAVAAKSSNSKARAKNVPVAISKKSPPKIAPVVKEKVAAKAKKPESVPTKVTPAKVEVTKKSGKKPKPTVSERPPTPVLKVILCGPHSVHWIPVDTVIHETIMAEGIHEKEQALAKEVKAPARRQEFLRARWLTRRMTRVKEPLLRGKSGEPLWPENFLGSISHKDGHVVAVKVTTDTHYAVGVDIERIAKLNEGIESKICNADESSIVDRVSALGRLARRDVLALVFAFKEALFKAHFPKGQKMFGFSEATITEIAYDRREIFARVNIDTSPHSPKDHVTMGFYNWIDYGGEKYVVVVAEERKPLQIDANLKQELLADT